MDEHDLLLLLRDQGQERFIRRRMRELRTDRGWTQDEVARRMKAAGCPIPQTAVSRLETLSAHSPRDVTVDELLAMARVFDVPLTDLLLPKGAAQHAERLKVLRVLGPQIWERLQASAESYNELVEEQRQAAETDSAWAALVRDEAASLTEEWQALMVDELWEKQAQLAFAKAVVERLDQGREVSR